MMFSLRHGTLLIGILSIIISFFWFGRSTGVYDILLLPGLAVACFSFVIILFKDTFKGKLIWSFIVLAAAGLQWITEPLLVKLSYRYYLSQHSQRLQSVTKILLTNKNNLVLTPDIKWQSEKGLTEQELNEITHQLKETGISLIDKDSTKIFYRTWGMLDISHGIYYFYGENRPDSRYRQIVGNWYY